MEKIEDLKEGYYWIVPNFIYESGWEIAEYVGDDRWRIFGFEDYTDWSDISIVGDYIPMNKTPIEGFCKMCNNAPIYKYSLCDNCYEGVNC